MISTNMKPCRVDDLEPNNPLKSEEVYKIEVKTSKYG